MSGVVFIRVPMTVAPSGLGICAASVAGDAAGLAEESADQGAQRIDDAHFGGVDRLRRKAIVIQAARIIRQALLYAVDRLVHAVLYWLVHTVFPLRR